MWGSKMNRYKLIKDKLEIEQDAIEDTENKVLYESGIDMKALCQILNQKDHRIKVLERALKLVWKEYNDYVFEHRKDYYKPSDKDYFISQAEKEIEDDSNY